MLRISNHQRSPVSSNEKKSNGCIWSFDSNETNSSSLWHFSRLRTPGPASFKRLRTLNPLHILVIKVTLGATLFTSCHIRCSFNLICLPQNETPFRALLWHLSLLFLLLQEIQALIFIDFGSFVENGSTPSQRISRHNKKQDVYLRYRFRSQH